MIKDLKSRCIYYSFVKLVLYNHDNIYLAYAEEL